jgi:hypothetical protein
MKKSKVCAANIPNNPVAKFAYRFNTAKVYADKRKYQRKSKHNVFESFSIALSKVIEKGSRFMALSFTSQGIQ